jgi:hypothetical protein
VEVEDDFLLEERREGMATVASTDKTDNTRINSIKPTPETPHRDALPKICFFGTIFKSYQS